MSRTRPSVTRSFESKPRDLLEDLRAALQAMKARRALMTPGDLDAALLGPLRRRRNGLDFERLLKLARNGDRGRPGLPDLTAARAIEVLDDARRDLVVEHVKDFDGVRRWRLTSWRFRDWRIMREVVGRPKSAAELACALRMGEDAVTVHLLRLQRLGAPLGRCGGLWCVDV